MENTAGGDRRRYRYAPSAASSKSRNDCVAALNFLRRRCNTPTGRCRSGACSFTATNRPCAISACMIAARTLSGSRDKYPTRASNPYPIADDNLNVLVERRKEPHQALHGEALQTIL